MTRMLGNSRPSWCSHCHAPPGPDCPDRGETTRQAKCRERREVRQELLDLAEDAMHAGIPLLAYLDAAASVRLDREGDGQTFSLESIHDDEEETDG